MGKILGIDYGRARVGLALTDALQITAQGLDSLETKGSQNVLIEKIKSIHSSSPLEEIVIGYPRHMNGDKSSMTDEIDILICKIEKLNIPVVKRDERLTTVGAYNVMKQMGVKQTKKKEYADRIAATHILEDYLIYKSKK